MENAFIYAPLDEVVYVHPHPEMGVPPGHCIKLLKSLYGLRQAPLNWNKHLHEFLASCGFKRSDLDYYVYTGTINSNPVLIALFVDDILIASAMSSVIAHVKSLFKQRFKVKDMGLAEEFLSIRIRQKPGDISIDQELYVNELLDKYSVYVGRRHTIHE